MTTPRFTKMLSLTESDQNRTEALRQQGIKIIDIYRAGLSKTEEEINKQKQS